MCTFAFGGGGWSLWVVDGRFGWPCHLLSTHHVRGHSSLFMFVGSRWLLLEVIIVGGGKEKGSHVTHHDNGITFECLREITCE